MFRLSGCVMVCFLPLTLANAVPGPGGSGYNRTYPSQCSCATREVALGTLACPCELSALNSLMGAFPLMPPHKFFSLLIAEQVGALRHRCFAVTGDVKVTSAMWAPPMIQRSIVRQLVFAIWHVSEPLARKASLSNEPVTLVQIFVFPQRSHFTAGR